MINDPQGTAACTAQAPTDIEQSWVAGDLSNGLELSVPFRIPPLFLAAIIDRITKTLLDLALPNRQEVLCVNTEAAAKLMSVSGRQLKRYIDEGKIVVVDLGTKCKRIRVTEIERFLKERSHKQSSLISSATRPNVSERNSNANPLSSQLTGEPALDATPTRHLKVLGQGRETQAAARSKRRPRRRKSSSILVTK